MEGKIAFLKLYQDGATGQAVLWEGLCEIIGNTVMTTEFCENDTKWLGFPLYKDTALMNFSIFTCTYWASVWNRSNITLLLQMVSQDFYFPPVSNANLLSQRF